MKCRLVVRMEASPSAKLPPGTWYEVGHVIDNPKAYMLVANGCAEPADEECERAAAMTPEQRIIAQQTYMDREEEARRDRGDADAEIDIEVFSDPEYL